MYNVTKDFCDIKVYNQIYKLKNDSLSLLGKRTKNIDYHLLFSGVYIFLSNKKIFRMRMSLPLIPIAISR